MKKLLRTYECNSDMQYYGLLRENFKLRNLHNAEYMFNKLPKENRKAFVQSILFMWSGVDEGEQIFFFNLL